MLNVQFYIQSYCRPDTCFPHLLVFQPQNCWVALFPLSALLEIKSFFNVFLTRGKWKRVCKLPSAVNHLLQSSAAVPSRDTCSSACLVLVYEVRVTLEENLVGLNRLRYCILMRRLMLLFFKWIKQVISVLYHLTRNEGSLLHKTNYQDFIPSLFKIQTL